MKAGSDQERLLAPAVHQAATARWIVATGLGRALAGLEPESACRTTLVCSALLLLGVEKSDDGEKRLSNLERMIFPHKFALPFLVEVVRRVRALVAAGGTTGNIAEALSLFGKPASDALCRSVVKAAPDDKSVALKIARECLGWESLGMDDMHTATTKLPVRSEAYVSMLLDCIGGFRMHLKNVLREDVSYEDHLDLWRGGLLAAVYAARVSQEDFDQKKQDEIYDDVVTDMNRLALGYEYWRDHGEGAASALRAIFPDLRKTTDGRFRELANKPDGFETDARAIQLRREGYRELLASVGIQVTASQLRTALSRAGISEGAKSRKPVSD